jgi:hypothetical protein
VPQQHEDDPDRSGDVEPIIQLSSFISPSMWVSRRSIAAKRLASS